LAFFLSFFFFADADAAADAGVAAFFAGDDGFFSGAFFGVAAWGCRALERVRRRGATSSSTSSTSSSSSSSLSGFLAARREPPW
jgi:hypothetical protein